MTTTVHSAENCGHHDITYYATDGRLTEPVGNERYEWRKMIDFVEKQGRPLTDEEAEWFKID